MNQPCPNVEQTQPPGNLVQYTALSGLTSEYACHRLVSFISMPDSTWVAWSRIANKRTAFVVLFLALKVE